jgi:hypothetical protein
MYHSYFKLGFSVVAVSINVSLTPLTTLLAVSASGGVGASALMTTESLCSLLKEV